MLLYQRSLPKRNYFKTETDNVTKDSPSSDTVECAFVITGIVIMWFIESVGPSSK
jgi:hypothetical protein